MSGEEFVLPPESLGERTNEQTLRTPTVMEVWLWLWDRGVKLREQGGHLLAAGRRPDQEEQQIIDTWRSDLVVLLELHPQLIDYGDQWSYCESTVDWPAPLSRASMYWCDSCASMVTRPDTGPKGPRCPACEQGKLARELNHPRRRKKK